MWRKLKPLLILLSVALNIAFLSVWAIRVLPEQICKSCDHDSARKCASCPLYSELGASTDQLKQLEPKQAAFRKASQELCVEAQDYRERLIELIAASPPDMPAISAYQDSITDTQKRMQILLVNHLLAEKQLLTPDQQRKLFALMRQECGCGQGSKSCLR